MKVYVVESFFGYYEDHYSKIEGIFSFPLLADEVAQKIRDYYGAFSGTSDPFDSISSTEFMSESQLEEFYSKCNEWNIASDYIDTNISEYELDKVNYKFL